MCVCGAHCANSDPSDNTCIFRMSGKFALKGEYLVFLSKLVPNDGSDALNSQDLSHIQSTYRTRPREQVRNILPLIFQNIKYILTGLNYSKC